MKIHFGYQQNTVAWIGPHNWTCCVFTDFSLQSLSTTEYAGVWVLNAIFVRVRSLRAVLGYALVFWLYISCMQNDASFGSLFVPVVPENDLFWKTYCC